MAGHAGPVVARVVRTWAGAGADAPWRAWRGHGGATRAGRHQFPMPPGTGPQKVNAGPDGVCIQAP